MPEVPSQYRSRFVSFVADLLPSIESSIEKLLEVAAANEATLTKLLRMIDDFDKRLRLLEDDSLQEKEAYEEILNRGRR